MRKPGSFRGLAMGQHISQAIKASFVFVSILWFFSRLDANASGDVRLKGQDTARFPWSQYPQVRTRKRRALKNASVS